MDDVKGQVSTSAADIYEEFFVPNLFRAWTESVLGVAALCAGQHVLDVACGTGTLAREAFDVIQPHGSVSGVDLNEGMLTVAARVAPEIEWKQASAEKLPYADDSFDAVLSQFGLMFFEDKEAAVVEMCRVLKPGGQITIAVWGSLENSPGYLALTNLLTRLFGEKIANELKAPYALGDEQELISLFEGSGLKKPQITTAERTTRYPSVEMWMKMDVEGWTISDMIDAEGYARLVDEARIEMKEFIQSDGHVAFPSPALIVSVQKGE